MYQLSFGNAVESKVIGNYETPLDIHKAILKDLEARGSEGSYFRICGIDSTSLFVDYGNYTKFYYITGVDVEFEEFILGFYEEVKNNE